MALYEHIFLTRHDISAQQVEGLTGKFQSILEENGGKVTKVEYWGLKTLAYRMKKSRKAHFSLLNIDAPHSAVAEMERQMRLKTDVIRFMTVRVDEHEDGPSAMMKKSDRDDRRSGGRRPPFNKSGTRVDRTEATDSDDLPQDDMEKDRNRTATAENGLDKEE